MEFSHISVLLSESVECLMIKSGGTYVDGTLGGGGHSKEICARLQEGRLVAIDQDAEAINAAKNVLSGYENITTFVHSNFSDISEQLRNLNIKNIDGCLLDLGVSSFQLDEARRGFSYMYDAPLDMRMDASQKLTAYDIINKYTESELSNIIFRYGEERWAKRIAKFIVEERKRSPVETTLELVSVIKAAMPKAVQFEGGHPAKRTFQAIRIEVNNELEILEGAVKDIVELLNPKGRLAIITFHSLEDRIIKNAFRNLENPCTCPHDFPVCMCKKKSAGTVITKKPIIPSVEEIHNNSRSKSAKLRVFEKIFE